MRPVRSQHAKWLKSTIATLTPDGEPQLRYEDVDTSLIPPRPRLYGLVGAEVIEEVWKRRQAARSRLAATDRQRQSSATKTPVGRRPAIDRSAMAEQS